nr:E3 ubiquitin-protein ligase CIP8-like [Ipomoea batatas]
MDHSILNVHCWIRHEPNILRTADYLIPPQDVFVFQMKVKDMVGFYEFHPEGQSPSERFILDYWEHHRAHLSEDFLIPFPDLAGSDRNRARHIIHKLLGEVGIPRHKRRPLLGNIFSEVMRLAKESDVDGEYKRIPIMVELRRVYTRTVSNVESEEDMDSEAVVPTSRSVIEGLERVRVEETEVCAVCLDEMEGGSEGTMLPCKHIFHGRCIDAWLVKANLCPLCRFQLSCFPLTSPQIFEDGWN